MSPGRALEKLFEAAPEAYKVTIFNAEPRVNYDRIMLSPVLSGEKTFEQIVIHGDGWYVDHGVTLYKGHRVVAIDRDAKTVTSAHGVVEPYDKLIIATGSMPIVIPVPGSKLAGVLTYRDLDDVNAMLLAAQVSRQGGRDRRRPARPRSRDGPQGAGHGGQRHSSHADADGAPARPALGLLAQAGDRGARRQGLHQGQHQGDPRHGSGERPVARPRGPTRRRDRASRRPRGHGGRHPAERGACP